MIKIRTGSVNLVGKVVCYNNNNESKIIDVNTTIFELDQVKIPDDFNYIDEDGNDLWAYDCDDTLSRILYMNNIPAGWSAQWISKTDDGAEYEAVINTRLSEENIISRMVKANIIVDWKVVEKKTRGPRKSKKIVESADTPDNTEQ